MHKVCVKRDEFIQLGDSMKKFFAAIMFMSSFAYADVIECTSGQDKRILEVAGLEKGCELKYTKAGNVEIKATQKIGDSKCVEVRERIQKTLEGAGYTCGEVK
jgi:hypothetical protein